jgi:CHAT domain-containing protein
VRLAIRAEDYIRELERAEPNAINLRVLRANLATARSRGLNALGQQEQALNAAKEGIGLNERLLADETASAGKTQARIDIASIRLSESFSVLIAHLMGSGQAFEALLLAESGLARARAESRTVSEQALWALNAFSANVAAARYEQAQKMLTDALPLFQSLNVAAAGNNYSLLLSNELTLLMAIGQWPLAERKYAALLEATKGDQAAYSRVNNAGLAAILAAKNGRADEALEKFEPFHRYRVRVYGPDHPSTIEGRGVRGFALLQKGSIRAALAEYEPFFSALLDKPGSWQDVGGVGARGRILNVVTEEFLRYAANLSTKPEAAADLERLMPRAIQLLDRSAVSSTQQAVSDASAKVRANTPALAALVAAEQEQRSTLREAYRTLEGLARIDPAKLAPDAQRDHKAKVDDNRKQAQTLTALISQSRESLAASFPAYGSLVNPPSPNPAAMQAVLSQDEVMIGVHPMTEFTMVWLIGQGKTRLHRADISAGQLAQQVASLRQQLDASSASASGQPPAFNRDLAHQLYRTLLAPLEADFKSAKTLIFSSQQALASLPLAVLIGRPPSDSEDLGALDWLGRRHELVQVPSASSLASLRRLKANVADKAFIGFGDPEFGPPTKPSGSKSRNLVFGATASHTSQASQFSLETGLTYRNMPALPDTRDELLAIATALKADLSTDLLLGNKATRPAVMSADLASRRVIAFATHGLLPGDLPGLSRPALAMASQGNNETPFLTLDDVMQLKLNAQLVLLSACNTASGDGAGVAMSGLIRGFFFAGARAVMATHWGVDSESAKMLMSRTFSLIGQGQSRAGSLRAAQLAMIEGKLGPAEYAHPFYWAPYALFGDPVR